MAPTLRSSQRRRRADRTVFGGVRPRNLTAPPCCPTAVSFPSPRRCGLRNSSSRSIVTCRRSGRAAVALLVPGARATRWSKRQHNHGIEHPFPVSIFGLPAKAPAKRDSRGCGRAVWKWAWASSPRSFSYLSILGGTQRARLTDELTAPDRPVDRGVHVRPHERWWIVARLFNANGKNTIGNAYSSTGAPKKPSASVNDRPIWHREVSKRLNRDDDAQQCALARRCDHCSALACQSGKSHGAPLVHDVGRSSPVWRACSDLSLRRISTE